MIGGAPRINEGVLFHRPSKTLLCADLMFNVTHPANRRTKLVLAMMGVGGRRLAQSRVWKLAVRDRPAARSTLDRLLTWPIQRVAPVHGDVASVEGLPLAPVMARAYGGTPSRQLGA